MTQSLTFTIQIHARKISHVGRRISATRQGLLPIWWWNSNVLRRPSGPNGVVPCCCMLFPRTQRLPLGSSDNTSIHGYGESISYQPEVRANVGYCIGLKIDG